MAPDGWIANGAGGWIAPDGAHWGAREQPPLKLANDKWSQQRAQERREERLRHSNNEHLGHDEHESYAFDEEGDDTITPQQRKQTTENGISNDMGMCTGPSGPMSTSRYWSRTGSW